MCLLMFVLAEVSFDMAIYNIFTVIFKIVSIKMHVLIYVVYNLDKNCFESESKVN